MRRLGLAALLAVGLALGCQRRGLPSSDYVKARGLWLDLLREKRDKAYLDPAVPEVLDLLGRVDARSASAPSAASLKEEIQRGRAEALEAEATLARRVAEAQAAARPAAGTFLAWPASPPAAPDGKEAQAAKAEESGPKPGMSGEELERAHGRCFELKNDALVDGRPGAQIWGLKDLANCRDLYRSFIDRSAVLVDGRVESVRPNNELAPKKYKLVDGRLVLADQEEATKAAPVPASAPPTPQPTAPASMGEQAPATDESITSQP